MSRRLLACIVVATGSAGAVACAGVASPPSASANVLKTACGAASLASGAAGKVCGVVTKGGKWVKAGKKLVTGHVGGAAKALGEGASKAASAGAGAAGIAVLAVSVLGGAKFALHETATLLSDTSSPELTSTWFSARYWRVAGIAVLLTLPFLFAAAIQALLRSDLTLLLQAAFGYLPLAMLAVTVAAPITMLLLAASDEMSAVVSSATGATSTVFVGQTVSALGILTLKTGPFMAFFVALLVVAAAVVLWIELLMREAAVYVIVLMLPLAFAAMVWPARRIWAIRAVELLVALVISKFAIVAVLSLGGAALSSGANPGSASLTAVLIGLVLLLMGAFTPWALLRLLPLAEIGASAAGSLSSQTRDRARPAAQLASGLGGQVADWAESTVASMQRDVLDVPSGPPSASGTVVGGEDQARPQGGPEATVQDVDEATKAPPEPKPEPEPDPDPVYNVSDVPIDEMHKPEHKGKWTL
jgi:hypothetical protein